MKIKDVIIKTFLSIQSDLVNSYKLCQSKDNLFDKCFELLTFNILIDKKEKPWLLSVNSAPDFNYKS